MTLNFVDGLFFKQQNITLKENFEQTAFVNEIVKIYQKEGYSVNAVKKGDVDIIDIEKNKGGIGMFFGKEQTITIECKQEGGVLTLDYSNGAWLGKIVGIGFGVILCYVPTVLSIIGVVNQNKLYKSIVENARNLAQK